ncbi:MAG TPA: hypothetical protein VFQ61_11465 [Polyangiaceae bacterium]|nr:hypothetical protein [Polyangiaceae bacterium]
MRIWLFFQEGGWSMWFVLLLGIITLAAAGGFARHPHSAREQVVTFFSRATICAIVSGVALNLATVGSQVSTRPEWAQSPQIHLLVLSGIAESLAPAILGFSFLAVSWVLMAVGQRRFNSTHAS